MNSKSIKTTKSKNKPRKGEFILTLSDWTEDARPPQFPH